VATASGELKVLVVFAKFKDDTTSHQFWPEDSYPSEMYNFMILIFQMGSTHFLNLPIITIKCHLEFQSPQAIGVENSFSD